MKKKLTLKDIAEKAGVSLTTASMYLNGKAEKYKISKATCERIEKAIKENNYNPNIHARAIAGKKTYLIGVITVGEINKSFWFDIISGIEEAITPHKYHMILSVSHYDAEKELEAIEFMKTKSVDGLIIGPVSRPEKNNHAFLRKLSKEIPLVVVSSKLKGLSCAYNDEKTGGELAADFLYKKGHRKIASIGGKENGPQSRINDFTEALALKGLDIKRFDNTSDFMLNHKDFTAVFCFSDLMALNLYNDAAKAGVTIPDELSVVGYDNMDFVKFLNPGLTTVHQYKKELGVAAAELLMDKLKNKNIGMKSKAFKPVLKERDSVSIIK
jgi:LacI family transcriptional regulator